MESDNISLNASFMVKPFSLDKPWLASESGSSMTGSGLNMLRHGEVLSELDRRLSSRYSRNLDDYRLSDSFDFCDPRIIGMPSEWRMDQNDTAQQQQYAMPMSSSSLYVNSNHHRAAIHDNSHDQQQAVALSNKHSGRQHGDPDREDLKELNMKFSVYLCRVKQLEQENHKLESGIEKMRQEWDDEISNLNDMKRMEMYSLRDALHQNYAARCSFVGVEKELELECQWIQTEIDHLHIVAENYSKNIHYLTEQNTAALEQINVLETSIINREHEVKNLTNEYGKHSDNLKGLRSELREHYVERLQMHTELQLIKTLVMFMRTVNDELAKMYHEAFTCCVEPTQFYRAELSKAIAGIRTDFNSLEESQREEIDYYYGMRLEELRKEIEYSRRAFNDAKTKEKIGSQELAGILEEVSQTNQTKAGLERERVQLNSYLRILENELEGSLQERKEKETQCVNVISDLQFNIQRVKDSMNQSFEDTMTLKVEINEYKILLGWDDSIDERPQTVKAKTDYKVVDNIPEPSRQTPSSHSVPALRNKVKTKVTMEKCTDDNKCITLTNCSDVPLDLVDWSLRQHNSSATEKVDFEFPFSTVIQPYRRLKVYCQKEESSADGVNSTDSTEESDSIVAETISSWYQNGVVDLTLHSPNAVNGKEALLFATEN